jgi:hypothetical protein
LTQPILIWDLKSYIELIDQSGRVIDSVNDNEIDLRNLENGVYYIRVNKVKTKKLVIRK